MGGWKRGAVLGNLKASSVAERGRGVPMSTDAMNIFMGDGKRGTEIDRHEIRPA